MVYLMTDEKVVIVPEDMVTAPFSDTLKNKVYLQTLASNSSAFAGIDTQVLTIPQVQGSDGDTSKGSTGVIIGVVVGISVVVLGSGFAVYRWNKSQRNWEQWVQQQEPNAVTQGSPQKRMPMSEVTTPVVPVVAMQHSIPEIGGSNVQRMAGLPQFLLQYKDQVRSVLEDVSENEVPFADVTPMSTSELEPGST